MADLHEILTPYVQKLGLRWPIRHVHRPGGRALVSIISRQGLHEIRHSESTAINIFETPGTYSPLLGSFVHELCHAYLAERIDPIFSGAKFLRRWARATRRERGRFVQKQQLFFSFDGRVVDLWVNDVYNEFWPDLYQTHRHRYGFLLAHGHTVPFGSIALYLAEARRHHLPHFDVSHVEHRSIYPGDEMWTEETAASFSRHLESLPQLAFRRDSDLRAYEEADQKAAQLLRFPINPRLIKEDNQMVWEL